VTGVPGMPGVGVPDAGMPGQGSKSSVLPVQEPITKQSRARRRSSARDNSLPGKLPTLNKPSQTKVVSQNDNNAGLSERLSDKMKEKLLEKLGKRLCEKRSEQMPETLRDKSREEIHCHQQTVTKLPARALWARFIRLSRMLFHNPIWARMIAEQSRVDVTKSNQKDEDDGEYEHNPNMYRSDRRLQTRLTPTARRLLIKLPTERTKADLFKLGEILDRLKCFKKFYWQTRRDLAGVVYYDSFEDGRIIVKEGHPSHSLYFIMSGKVLVTQEEEHKFSGVIQTNVLGFMEEGASFGELALLHNMRRTATIRCKGSQCEFLRVDRDDFDGLLRDSYEQEWQDKKSVIHGLPCFSNWTEADLNILSRVKVYKSEAVIVSEDTTEEHNVHFIQSGTCIVVREVANYVENKQFGRQKVLFPSDKLRNELRERQANCQVERRRHRRQATCRYREERRFWQIATFKSGQYFNIGEDLRDTRIIASERVVCLLVPRVQFMLHQNEQAMDQMRKELDVLIPRQQSVFKMYIRDFKWAQYTRSVVDGVFKDKPNSKVLKKDTRRLSDTEHCMIKHLSDIV